MPIKKIVLRQGFKDPLFQAEDNQVPIITMIKLNIPTPAEWAQRRFNFYIFEPLSDKISVLSSIRCHFGFGFGIGHLSGIPTKITPLFFFVPIFVTFNQPSLQPPSPFFSSLTSRMLEFQPISDFEEFFWLCNLFRQCCSLFKSIKTFLLKRTDPKIFSNILNLFGTQFSSTNTAT